MTQPPLFGDARDARDDALNRVDEAADQDWKDRALEAVYQLCQSQPVFTSEDIWELIEKPREPRALGPVMLRAVKLGYCEPGGFVNCSMVSRHAAPVRQYHSRIREAQRPGNEPRPLLSPTVTALAGER